MYIFTQCGSEAGARGEGSAAGTVDRSREGAEGGTDTTRGIKEV